MSTELEVVKAHDDDARCSEITVTSYCGPQSDDRRRLQLTQAGHTIHLTAQQACDLASVIDEWAVCSSK